MKKLKTIIVDDEFAARNVLSNLLGLSFPNIEIVASSDNLSDAVDLIKENKPDLVFLDVEMPNYAGYEIIRFFDKIDFHIIFITAYNQYAVNAFEINAVDYLLKPIERPRLKTAVEKVQRKIEEEKISIDYNKLIDELESKENQTIALSESGSKHLITLKSIIAIYAQGAYSEVFIEDNKKILVSKNIGALEEELSENDCFSRTHKSWIINKNHIVTYQKGKLALIMEDDIIAKVSRYRKEEFEEELENI